MRLLIIILTIFFVLSVFLGNLNLPVGNPFFAYILYQINLIITYIPLFLILFVFIFVVFLRKYYPRKKKSPQIFLHNFIQIVFAVIISVLSAYVIILLIVFIELNIYSAVIKYNPHVLGINTQTEAIYNKLKNNSIVPKIILGEKDSKNAVVAIAKSSGGADNLYSTKLLNSIPGFLILPLGKTSSNLMLLDNYLIINSLNATDIEKISPVLGYLYLQENFPLRQIKAYPRISVMDKSTFQKFRQKDFVDKKIKIDNEISKMQSSISSLSAQILIDNQNIENSRINSGEILKARDKEYNACLSKGKYINGKFIPENTEDYCKEILSKWEKDYNQQEKIGSDLVKKLTLDQKKLKEYQYYENYFSAYKSLNDVTSLNIPSELGVFEPDSSIRILYDKSSPTNIADYLETLIHEYLHYTSYIKGKRLDSSFFEEGLTAYFARQTIETTMNTKTNIGYPLIVRVMDEFMKKNAEVDLADIYFTKDQEGLEKRLDLVYGDNFYKDNIIQLESLLYISDPDLALKTVNKIMKKIGGQPLTKEDILSTKSNIN
jgi:hypothetical protein